MGRVIAVEDGMIDPDRACRCLLYCWLSFREESFEGVEALADRVEAGRE